MKRPLSFLFIVFLTVTFSAAAVQQDEEMDRKLRGAVMLGNIDEAKAMIQAGADVNKKFDLGATRNITPLFLLCAFGNANQAEIGTLLISAGARVDEEFDGMTLLHIAAGFAGNKGVMELLIANGLNVNEKLGSVVGEIEGSTPLHLAAARGNKEAAEVLLRHGVEVDINTTFHQYTPLHLAALNGKKETAELLVAEGADVNSKSMYGETPLDLALSKGHEETADSLRALGGVSGKKQAY